ncbi:hypothetical protein PV326_007531 [Microctonus aethiopoides]|nr:hypothetical protein PV326_007531 [Microctonus aethiopoides]
MNSANYVLSLKDEVGEMFMLYLTSKEHERAIGDMLYASQLLNRYKNAIAMQLYNVQQSNLTLIMKQMKAHEVDKTCEQLCINKMENLKKSYKKPEALTISLMPWIKPMSLTGNSVPLTHISNDSLTSLPCKKMKLALTQAKIDYFEDAIKNRQLKRKEKASYNERKLQIFEKIAESLKK